MEKIITRTPLRISFVGGGTDIGYFYRKHGGEVISTAIDKYITVTVSPRDDSRIEVKGPDNRMTFYSVDEIRHPLVREAMKRMTVSVPPWLTIEVGSDMPPRGTGLGSSSALTVGLIHALSEYRRRVTGYRADCLTEVLAQVACEIEIDILGNPIGKQDQYIAAYGGFRRFEFCRDGDVDDEVVVESLELNMDLQKHLTLFYTGVQRDANAILSDQGAKGDVESLMKIKKLVGPFYDALGKYPFPVVEIGEILKENWHLKRGLAGSISNSCLDEVYRLALEAGATGGKLLGAGGGGFFLFCVPVEKLKAVIGALDGLALHTPFCFEPRGSYII